MIDNKIRNLLESIPPFSELPGEETTKLLSHLSEDSLPAGTRLSVQGHTRIDHVSIIDSGLLEIYYEKDGQRFLTGYLKNGDIFGGISLLMNDGMSLRSVSVEKDVTLYRIPKDVFLDLCARFKFFNKHFVEVFSKRTLDETYAEMVSSSRAFLFLSGVIPFSFLPEEEIQQISLKLSIEHAPPDRILFIQGQSKIDHLYIIQKGAAERYYEEKNQKNLRGILGEGDIYGGISILLNNGIAVRMFRTLEETYFYRLPKQRFLELCDTYEAFSEYFTDTFGKRMLDRSYASIITRTAVPKDETMQLFNQPVSNLISRDIVACDKDISIQKAAEEMSRRHCSSILVQSGTGEFVGMLTDNDLRNKVIAKGHDIGRPVSDIMSDSLYAIDGQSLVFEALMEMMQKNIKHLAISDAVGKVVGIITNSDLLTAQGQSPFFLLREIKAAARLEELFDKYDRLPRLLQHLIKSGVQAKNVTALITTISDAILNRIIDFALEKHGPPPCRFVFMIVGSEGRKEQTLKTDQDNAIIFEDVPESSLEEVRAYFLKFGESVCTWLDKAGYAYCDGGVMAKNPQWCQPLSVWKDYFLTWVRRGEGEALLKASIFFDFRGGYGDGELIDELRRHLFGVLVDWAGFFRNLTENALHFKPPIGFFRNFVVESKGEHRNSLDIKSAMMPIVDFSRIYALKNGIEETNTQERLKQLGLKKILAWGDYNELDKGYGFLMQLRFVRQISAIIDENARPDNYINPKRLSRLEQTMLKEIFKRVEKFQTKLGFDFTGIG